MKVREIIERLNAYSPDAEVVVLKTDYTGAQDDAFEVTIVEDHTQCGTSTKHMDHNVNFEFPCKSVGRVLID